MLARATLGLAVCLWLGCTSGPNTLTLTEKDDGRTTELAIGDTLIIALPGAATGGKRWQPFDLADPNVLEFKDVAGDTTPTKLSFTAKAGGETTLSYYLDDPAATASFQWFRATVRVSGAAVTGGQRLPPSRNHVSVVGGFGPSRESGEQVLDLRLFPTDLTVSRKTQQLLVPSEGRLWSIDPTSLVGTIRLEGPNERTDSQLPAAASICSAFELANGDLWLGLLDGPTEWAFGLLAPDGTWTEKDRFTRPAKVSGCRVRPAPTQEKGYLGAGGGGLEVDSAGTAYSTFPAGTDSQGSVLLWRTENPSRPLGDWTLAKAASGGSVEALFLVAGGPNSFATNFYPVLPESLSDPASNWPAATAAVGQTPDGRYWSYSVWQKQVAGLAGQYLTEGRGLFTLYP